MFKDTSTGYGVVSIVLHWLTAILVFGLFGLGIYMVGLSYYDDMYHKAPALHVSLGLILLILTLIRLPWRLFSRQPEEIPGQKPAARFAAKAVKSLLYILTLILLVTGYLITTADGKAASLFGLVDFPVFVTLGADGVDLAGSVHELLAWGIVLLAGLHGVAALLHHFVFRDRTLIRMLKPVRK